MNRFALAAIAAGLFVLAACGDGSGPAPQPVVIVTPILDSLFVGDTLAPKTVTYLDAAGDTQPTGPVRWLSGSPSVFTVDSVSGIVVGTGAGIGLLYARANGVTGQALLVVSRPLEIRKRLTAEGSQELRSVKENCHHGPSMRATRSSVSIAFRSF